MSKASYIKSIHAYGLLSYLARGSELDKKMM